MFGIDETVERRGGPKICARGIYRDAVPSSRSYLVKVSGPAAGSVLMWLGHIPWAGRYWALPFLTVLAPSERYFQQRGRTPQKLTGRARQDGSATPALAAPPTLVLVRRQRQRRLGPAALLPIAAAGRLPS